MKNKMIILIFALALLIPSLAEAIPTNAMQLNRAYLYTPIDANGNGVTNGGYSFSTNFTAQGITTGNETANTNNGTITQSSEYDLNGARFAIGSANYLEVTNAGDDFCNHTYITNGVWGWTNNFGVYITNNGTTYQMMSNGTSLYGSFTLLGQWTLISGGSGNEPTVTYKWYQPSPIFQGIVTSTNIGAQIAASTTAGTNGLWNTITNSTPLPLHSLSVSDVNGTTTITSTNASFPGIVGMSTANAGTVNAGTGGLSISNSVGYFLDFEEYNNYPYAASLTSFVPNLSEGGLVIGATNWNVDDWGNAKFSGGLTIGGTVASSSISNQINNGVQAATTNTTLYGQVNLPANSDIAFSRYANTTLANGNNSDIILGTNVFVELSGNTAPVYLAGFSAGPAQRDGAIRILLYRGVNAATIGNLSGIESTSGNRVTTMTGQDRYSAGPFSATLVYDASAGSWMLTTFESISSIIAGGGGGATNGIQMFGGYGTNTYLTNPIISAPSINGQSFPLGMIIVTNGAPALFASVTNNGMMAATNIFVNNNAAGAAKIGGQLNTGADIVDGGAFFLTAGSPQGIDYQGGFYGHDSHWVEADPNLTNFQFQSIDSGANFEIQNNGQAYSSWDLMTYSNYQAQVSLGVTTASLTATNATITTPVISGTATFQTNVIFKQGIDLPQAQATHKGSLFVLDGNNPFVSTNTTQDPTTFTYATNGAAGTLNQGQFWVWGYSTNRTLIFPTNWNFAAGAGPTNTIPSNSWVDVSWVMMGDTSTTANQTNCFVSIVGTNNVVSSSGSGSFPSFALTNNQTGTVTFTGQMNLTGSTNYISGSTTFAGNTNILQSTNLVITAVDNGSHWRLWVDSSGLLHTTSVP